MNTRENENVTWTVVKFIGDNTVNVVPTCWIHNEDKCYWPPLPADKITQAIKSGLLNTHWPSHKISIFRNATYDSYEVAHVKSRKAEDTSDLNTTEDEMSNIRKRKRIIKSYSSSDEEISDDNNNDYVKPPTLKKTLRGPSSVNNTELDVSTYSNLETWDDFPDRARTQLSNKSPNIRSQSLVSQLEPTTPRSAMQNNIPGISGSSTNIQNSCVCCPDVKKFLKEILRQQHLIRTRINDLEQQLERNDVSHKPEDDYAEFVFSGFNLPINAVEQFTDFNEFINNEENFSKSLKELSKTGGNNTYEFVKRILSIR